MAAGLSPCCREGVRRLLSKKQWEFLFLKWVNGPLSVEEIDSLFETIDGLSKENEQLKSQIQYQTYLSGVSGPRD